MIQLGRLLRGARRQQSGLRQIGRAVRRRGGLRLDVGRRNGQTHGIQPVVGNDIAHERLPCAGTAHANRTFRIVDHVQPAAGRFALREIADPLQCRGRGKLRGVRLCIVVAFPGQPEERPVLAVVDLGDPHRAAETRSKSPVRLLGQRNAGRVVEEIVGRPTGLAHGPEQAAVPLVGARFQVGVEHAAAGARHFRVIGIGLNLDLFHGFQRRNDDRPVGGVGDRNPVQQIIVATHGTARDGDLRRPALVFHAVVVRIAHRRHILRQLRHHERIAPEVGKIHQLLAVEHLPLRGV